jgi:hypothetical protein
MTSRPYAFPPPQQFNFLRRIAEGGCRAVAQVLGRAWETGVERVMVTAGRLQEVKEALQLVGKHGTDHISGHRTPPPTRTAPTLAHPI